MEASTLVASLATSLSVSWTGSVGEKEASVVFLWPSGEKVYFDLDNKNERVQGNNKKLVNEVKSALTELNYTNSQ